MKSRPECAMTNCTNPGFVGFAGEWVCGECYMKWEKAQQAKAKQSMEDAVNGN